MFSPGLSWPARLRLSSPSRLTLVMSHYGNRYTQSGSRPWLQIVLPSVPDPQDFYMDPDQLPDINNTFPDLILAPDPTHLSAIVNEHNYHTTDKKCSEVL